MRLEDASAKGSLCVAILLLSRARPEQWSHGAFSLAKAFVGVLNKSNDNGFQH